MGYLVACLYFLFQDQYLLYGLPGGLFLLPVGGWRPAAETCQVHLGVLGLFDWLQRICHHYEEYSVGKINYYYHYIVLFRITISMLNCLFSLPDCQILACGFIKSLVLNHCWLIQLFSLACTIKGYTKRMYYGHNLNFNPQTR